MLIKKHLWFLFVKVIHGVFQHAEVVADINKKKMGNVVRMPHMERSDKFVERFEDQETI